MPRALCRRIVEAFPDADCRVVYDPTEAEPVAHVGMRDVLAAGAAQGCSSARRCASSTWPLLSLPKRIDGPVAAGALAGSAAGEVVVAGRT